MRVLFWALCFKKSEKLERAERKAIEMTGSSEILSSEKGQKEARLKKKEETEGKRNIAIC